jgi:hypothetical protein
MSRAVSGQFAGPAQFDPSMNPFQSGLLYPRIPPPGDWLEVVTVTPKWVVLQNQMGQQFPVSLDSVELFVMRWPTSLPEISPNALIEATGVEVNANQIRTDHMDVFDGIERRFVMPTVEQVVGFNRVVTAFDLDMMNTYGIRFPLLPIEEQMPTRLHVVGPLIGVNPVRVAIPGNNAVAIFPAVNGIYITQVTAGSPQYVRPGDLVYAVASTMTPRTVVLSQLVVYKSMSINQFIP